MLLIIVVAIITGAALYKDIEHQTAETIYTLPINEKRFFLGKFLAAYLINVSICLAYPLGLAIMQYTGVGPPEKFGPTPWGQLCHGFLIFTIPNLLFLTSMVIASVVFFRNMVAGYIGIFLLVLCFLIAETTRENAANLAVIYLLDPFAYTITVDTLEALPVVEKNTGYFPISPLFVINRVIWLSLSVLLTLLSYKRFSFKYFITAPTKKRKIIFDEDISTQPLPEKSIPMHQTFSTLENIRKTFRLSLLEMKNVVRPIGFIVIMGILAITFFLYNVLWNAEYYITTDTLPLTSAMTSTRIPTGIFLFILLLIWSGELLYKERTVNISQLTDALPVPTWVTYISKFFAMALVSFLLSTVLLACGLLGQLFNGFYDIEWSVYIEHLYGYQFGWITYLLVIAMGFFFGALTGRRFVGHILSVALLFFIIVSAEFGLIEQVRFMYPFAPGVEDYSEMNGFGIFGVAAQYYALMWTLLAVAILAIGIWVWNRGAEKSFLKRISIKNPQMPLMGKLCVPVLLLGFVLLQNHIVKNVNATGNFKTETQEKAEAAEYEKQYKHLETQAHPKISGLDLSIIIFPENRRAEYIASLDLTNTWETPIDTLHLSVKDFVTIESISIENEALASVNSDQAHQQYAFRLPKPLQANETTTLKVECTLDYIGFSQSDPQADLTFNGTLMGRDIIPIIGYNDAKELERNRDRGDNGLVKLTSRMLSVDNAAALSQEVFSPDAIRHKALIQISTSAEQKVFAPGVLTKRWEEDGKSYSLYQIETPSPMHWYIGSGNYQTYQPTSETGVRVTILHDPRHDYNLKHFENAVKEGIDFIQENLGAYPYEQLTIAEIPFYEDDDFYAYPNVIAISEKHGWTADGTREKDLVYIYYSITRELIKQWIYQNLSIANVQGADMLRLALPDAMAMYFIKNRFGEQLVDQHLEKKEDRYKKGRGNEPNIEPPLLYADSIDYLEANKGSVELYHLIRELGAFRFNQTLVKWTEDNALKPVTFKHLYERLIRRLPEDQRTDVMKRFETVER
jgi:ABC-type transport system involved in multi-copper enzyme maturation permease subunit